MASNRKWKLDVVYGWIIREKLSGYIAEKGDNVIFAPTRDQLIGLLYKEETDARKKNKRR